MNKAEWTDFFYYIKSLFFISKKRKVEKTLQTELNKDNRDSYKSNNNKNFYSKKRKKYDDYN